MPFRKQPHSLVPSTYGSSFRRFAKKVTRVCVDVSFNSSAVRRERVSESNNVPVVVNGFHICYRGWRYCSFLKHFTPFLLVSSFSLVRHVPSLTTKSVIPFFWLFTPSREGFKKYREEVCAREWAGVHFFRLIHTPYQLRPYSLHLSYPHPAQKRWAL